MPQFDVHPALNSQSGWLVNCQSDLLNELETVLVVPLLSPDVGPRPSTKLNPRLMFQGREVFLYTQYAAAVERRRLAPPLGTLWNDQDQVKMAIDFLIAGF